MNLVLYKHICNRRENYLTTGRFPRVSGRSPISAALFALSLLSRSAEARVPVLPAAAGLRVADPASVPFSVGVQRGSAAQTGSGSLRLRLRHLPLQQRTRAVSQTVTHLIQMFYSTHIVS